MARLLDLANELLLGVISFVRVEDIEAFTSCNRRIYRVSQDVLQKHRAMKKKFSRVQLTFLNPGTTRVHSSSVHPMVWLEIITLDETAASYPTLLHIHDNIRSHDAGKGYSSRISTDTKDLIYSKLDQCPYIPREELERWKKDIDSRQKISFDIALALLLTLLPNLQSISTDGLRKIPHCTENMVVQIAKAHHVDKEHTHPSSHLASLNHAGTPSGSDNSLGSANCPSIGLCLPFTGLPSFRSVSGDIVHGSTWDGLEDLQSLSKTFESAVTNINFTQSSISSLKFEKLLCRCGVLQVFKYEDDGMHFGELRFGRILDSLLTHAGHSLCSLDLSAKNVYVFPPGWCESPEDSDGAKAPLHCYVFMGSLRHFQVLRNVKVDSAMFIEKVLNADTDGKISSKVHRLVDILPASVEKLCLVARLGSRSSNRMFDGLVESKADVLPRLEEIEFEYSDPVTHDLKQACHEIGVELVDATTS